MHSWHRAGRAAARSRVPQFRDGKFVTRTTLRAFIQGMHCKWLGDVNRLQTRGGSEILFISLFSPMSFLSLCLNFYLSRFSRRAWKMMMNSFSLICRLAFQRGPNVFRVGDIVPPCARGSHVPHHSPSLFPSPCRRHTIGQMRTCAARPSAALSTWRAAF